jgi:hypothetical protein
MTKQVLYHCPGKKPHPPHEFSYLHHPTVEADPVPRFCGVCGYDSRGKIRKQALTSPPIQKPVLKSVDSVYRGMEEGAEFRATMAKEQFGLSDEDVSIMKMTNQKDGLRAGDTSDMPVVNEVSKLMDVAPQATGFQGAAGLGYSGTVSQGPFPNVGAHAQAGLRKRHAAFTSTSGMVGAASSSLPALETTQPGYRKRVAG